MECLPSHLEGRRTFYNRIGSRDAQDLESGESQASSQALHRRYARLANRQVPTYAQGSEASQTRLNES